MALSTFTASTPTRLAYLQRTTSSWPAKTGVNAL